MSFDGGESFDRFKAIPVGGGFGDAGVPGIRSNALTADRVTTARLGLSLPPTAGLRLGATLVHAEARALDDQKTYGLTGLALTGDLPGWGWFTAMRVDLGVGLQSQVPGVRTVNGYIALLRVF